MSEVSPLITVPASTCGISQVVGALVGLYYLGKSICYGIASFALWAYTARKISDTAPQVLHKQFFADYTQKDLDKVQEDYAALQTRIKCLKYAQKADEAMTVVRACCKAMVPIIGVGWMLDTELGYGGSAPVLDTGCKACYGGGPMGKDFKYPHTDGIKCVIKDLRKCKNALKTRMEEIRQFVPFTATVRDSINSYLNGKVEGLCERSLYTHSMPVDVTNIILQYLYDKTLFVPPVPVPVC